MMAYESKVTSIQNSVLDILQQHANPSIAGSNLLHAVSPQSITIDPSTGLTTSIKPPSSSEALLLSNSITSTLLHLVSMSVRNNVQAMSLTIGTTIDQPIIAHLIDACLWLAAQSPPLIDPGLPSQCVEIIVETITNEECEGVLAYLDSRLVEFKKPLLVTKSHHTLLRTCNLLLKRLSKSQNASLCGRVLMFLAKFLPLTERSGVNLYGTFHVDNVTPIETFPAVETKDQHTASEKKEDDAIDTALHSNSKDARDSQSQHQQQQQQPPLLDAEGHPVDTEFYTTFWKLQKWFSNPPTALDSNAWSSIHSSINATLTKFSTVKVTVFEVAPGTNKHHHHQHDRSPTAAAAAAMSDLDDDIKYLSSARLLPLQIRDSLFRRHFLVQCIILLDWIERPAFKEWTNQGAKGNSLEELQDLRIKLYQAMESTPQNGKDFAAAVKSLMTGEDAWVTWKQAGCPPEPLQVPVEKIPDALDAVEVVHVHKRPKLSADAVLGIRVGTDELDRLWNLTEDNLSLLGADDRGGFKTLHQLMEPVIEEMKEEASIGNNEEEVLDDMFKASKNVVYSWKTMRMVARDSLPAFAESVKRKNDLRVAARMLYPDEVPPEPERVEPEKVEPIAVAVAEEKVEHATDEKEEGDAKRDGELNGGERDEDVVEAKQGKGDEAFKDDESKEEHQPVTAAETVDGGVEEVKEKEELEEKEAHFEEAQAEEENEMNDELGRGGGGIEQNDADQEMRHGGNDVRDIQQHPDEVGNNPTVPMVHADILDEDAMSDDKIMID